MHNYSFEASANLEVIEVYVIYNETEYLTLTEHFPDWYQYIGQTLDKSKVKLLKRAGDQIGYALIKADDNDNGR